MSMPGKQFRYRITDRAKALGVSVTNVWTPAQIMAIMAAIDDVIDISNRGRYIHRLDKMEARRSKRAEIRQRLGYSMTGKPRQQGD